MNKPLVEFPMFISKSSLSDGEMRWAAVNSDTDWDLYGEKMTLELYKSMIAKIKSNTPPPEMFAEMVTSDFWKGGMPYLSIAHYSDGNGKAVPGDVRQLFIDGSQLKAKGNLFDNKLGRAVWKSLKKDELNYKNDVDADRIRISIAFLDLAHKHGDNGTLFQRKSITDVCPLCKKGVGEKIYVDGYLVHLALTTVPVNPRTIMEAEDIMAKKSKPVTRKDDAVAVLGDAELADEVVSASLEVKSDALVEMSDAEEISEPVVESSEPMDAPETGLDIVEAKSDGEYDDWKPYGGATTMKDAKAYSEAQQESWRVSDLYYTFQDVAKNIMEMEDVSSRASALSSLVDEFKKSLVAKSLYEELSLIQEGKLEETIMPIKKNELAEIVKSLVEASFPKKEDKSMDEEEMTPEEKKAKKAKMDAEAKKSDTVSEVVDAPVSEKSALEVSVDNLYNAVNQVVGKSGTSEEKLQAIQPALEALGAEIVAVVKSNSNDPAPVVAPQNDAILEAIQTLSASVQQMGVEIATMKAQTPASGNVQANRVPVPRSLALATKSAVPEVPTSGNSVKDIVRRSVGL